MYFKGEKHQTFFESAIDRLPFKPSGRMAAALYLLTADHSVWKTVRHNVEKNHICFEKVRLTDVSTNGYVLYRTARDLYLKETRITVLDLSDQRTVSDLVWHLIQTAISIKRNGLASVKND